jgi:hypothetical protein
VPLNTKARQFGPPSERHDSRPATEADRHDY